MRSCPLTLGFGQSAGDVPELVAIGSTSCRPPDWGIASRSDRAPRRCSIAPLPRAVSLSWAAFPLGHGPRLFLFFFREVHGRPPPFVASAGSGSPSTPPRSRSAPPSGQRPLLWPSPSPTASPPRSSQALPRVRNMVGSAGSWEPGPIGLQSWHNLRIAPTSTPSRRTPCDTLAHRAPESRHLRWCISRLRAIFIFSRWTSSSVFTSSMKDWILRFKRRALIEELHAGRCDIVTLLSPSGKLTCPFSSPLSPCPRATQARFPKSHRPAASLAQRTAVAVRAGPARRATSSTICPISFRDIVVHPSRNEVQGTGAPLLAACFRIVGSGTNSRPTPRGPSSATLVQSGIAVSLGIGPRLVVISVAPLREDFVRVPVIDHHLLARMEQGDVGDLRVVNIVHHVQGTAERHVHDFILSASSMPRPQWTS